VETLPDNTNDLIHLGEIQTRVDSSKLGLRSYVNSTDH